MSHIQSAIASAVKTLESLRPLEDQITRAADLVRTCLTSGGKLLTCGNGGSAADVSDFATEYVCRFLGDRKPFPALNMTVDGGLILAIGNDYAVEEVFSRQLQAFGRPGDVLVVATTSGNSPNILNALHEAKRMGLSSVALLGKDGGKAKGLATVELIVPTEVTARIQECHKFMFHVICELVDPALKAL